MIQMLIGVLLLFRIHLGLVVGEHCPGMDVPPLQVGGQPRGRVQARFVAVRGVVGEAGLAERGGRLRYERLRRECLRAERFPVEDKDIIYVIDCYRAAGQTSEFHAAWFNKTNRQIPVSWPHRKISS